MRAVSSFEMDEIDGMDPFQLDTDEKYDRLCGEIILTTKGNITLHCSMCDVVHKKLEVYIEHIFNEHLSILESQDIDEDLCDSVDEEQTEEENFLISEIDEVETLDDNEGDFAELLLDQNDSSIEATAEDDASVPIGFLGKNGSHQENNATLNDIKKIAEEPSDISEGARRIRSNVRKPLTHHTDGKKFECPGCKTKLRTEGEVRRHMRHHQRGREFLCSDCGKSYKRIGELNLHIKRHKNQRDFKCENCGKAYFYLFQLKRHRMVHTGARPFFCDLCGKTFLRAATLANHKNIHENQRSYKCKLCNKGFNQFQGLINHEKKVHKIA